MMTRPIGLGRRSWMANRGDQSPEGAGAPQFILDRRDAVPALIGRHEIF
jgi:hypothetical protein